MNNTPTCPKCGNHNFSLVVQQTIYVDFYVDFIEEGHQVVDGPMGDMEFDAKTFACCSECGHSDSLGEMKKEEA